MIPLSIRFTANFESPCGLRVPSLPWFHNFETAFKNLSKRSPETDFISTHGRVEWPGVLWYSKPFLPSEVGLTMQSPDLQRYKEALLEKKAEILRQETPPLGSGHFSAGDFGDQSNENHDAYIGLRLRQTDGKLLRAIDEAILRIERHSYGNCEMCGEEIPAARLKAVPWTRLCVACKESKDRVKGPQ